MCALCEMALEQRGAQSRENDLLLPGTPLGGCFRARDPERQGVSCLLLVAPLSESLDLAALKGKLPLIVNWDQGLILRPLVNGLP